MQNDRRTADDFRVPAASTSIRRSRARRHLPRPRAAAPVLGPAGDGACGVDVLMTQAPRQRMAGKGNDIPGRLQPVDPRSNVRGFGSSRPGPCQCRRRSSRRPRQRRRRPRNLPALRVRSQGFLVEPKSRLRVSQSASRSGTLVFPNTTAPAALSRAATADWRGGPASASAGSPQVVGIPARSNVSFRVIGRPWRGGSSPPPACCRSRASARRRAPCASIVTMALTSGFRASTASRHPQCLARRDRAGGNPAQRGASTGTVETRRATG